MRLHPAASRIEKLSGETPALFVAFDLLALGDDDLGSRPFDERRALLERALEGRLGEHGALDRSGVVLTPTTRSKREALRWFEELEGAGIEGLIAKPGDVHYEPKKRVMLKIKHVRTVDCVLGGFRWP